MLNKVKFLTLFFLSSINFNFLAIKNAPHEIFIIIPGTWAIKESWFKIGGDFFEALNKVAHSQGKHVIWFRWLTDHYESSRERGSEELAQFLTCFELHTKIHLVAHSHGANICIGASQILAKKYPERKITTLIALGAPIYEEVYKPNMNIIGRIFNLYSLNDNIQTIWAYKRIYQQQKGIHNLRIFVEDQEPNHTEMHNPIIAKWLPLLMNCGCPEESLIHFYQNQKPKIEKDLDQAENLANDKPLNLQAMFDLRKIKKHNEKRIPSGSFMIKKS